MAARLTRKVTNDLRLRILDLIYNRIGEIQELTDPNKLRHFPVLLNSADHISRGISAFSLNSDHRFIRGPHFLYLPKSEWPPILPHILVDPEDLEPLKRNHFLLLRPQPHLPPAPAEQSRQLSASKRAWRPDGTVRVMRVRTQTGTFIRPVGKLCLLELKSPRKKLQSAPLLSRTSRIPPHPCRHHRPP